MGFGREDMENKKGNYGKQPGDFEKAAEQNARFIENRGKSH